MSKKTHNLVLLRETVKRTVMFSSRYNYGGLPLQEKEGGDYEFSFVAHCNYGYASI